MSSPKEILVYAHWSGFKAPVLMGILSAISSKGKEIFSFEYAEEWLKSEFPFLLDPDLQLYSGRYFPRDEKQNFGLFLDSSPDRWGRVLMERREAVIARLEKRTIRRLHESDYLLGVYDGHRMGALRFKTSAVGNFLNDDSEMAAPPWTSLRELEHASRKFEEEDVDSKKYLEWLNLLMAPGSSLGGARPKASVLDPKNHLWIAKFPSVGDKKDIGGWEMVVHRLAKKAGIRVAEGSAKQFNSKHHTFISKRFDRNSKGERIHFSSAMTMLGYMDGAGHDTGVSYLELAEFIIRYGADVNADLEELWRRIVFNICVKNTDDHLRNHGFLLTGKGWRLSPAYDMNPNEFGAGLSLNISETDNALDLDLALSVAEYFRLDEKTAGKIIMKTKTAVSGWRKEAAAIGLPKSEQDRMGSAFEIAT
jgi:serine/threonine-protein kinase HipA